MHAPQNLERIWQHAADFASLLQDLLRVFSLPPGALKIFMARSRTKVAAFNNSGVLFVNLSCFKRDKSRYMRNGTACTWFMVRRSMAGSLECSS